jgi:hypothetical protein
MTYGYKKKEYAPIVDLLLEEPRSGRALEFDSKVEAQVALIACSDPPEGSGRWALHLICYRIDLSTRKSLLELLSVNTFSYCGTCICFPAVPGFSSEPFRRNKLKNLTVKIR